MEPDLDATIENVTPRTIAIDGPAGSGKSVIGLWLAQHLGYAYLDTGVLYRAIAYVALHDNIEATDAETLAMVAETIPIEVSPPTNSNDSRGYQVQIDGTDITDELFSPDVNKNVSTIAAHPAVRSALLPLQRRIASAGHVVLVGRDIGTVVMPRAELKLYMDASDEVRAHRRHAQEADRGIVRTYEQVLADVRLRDGLDQARATAPLSVAKDAIRFDTDTMTLDEERAAILALLERHN